MRDLSRRSRLAGLVLAGVLAPGLARAQEPARTPVPLRRNGGELAILADTSIASQMTLVGVGVRGGWFARESLEIGGELQASLLLASTSEPSRRPRPGDPTAAFRVTPMLRWMPLRTETFAAYLLAGAGPTVLGARGGVLGHVIAAPGALIHIGGRVWLDLAIRFTASFPGPKCRAAFAGPVAPGFCELQFGPQIGLMVAF